MQYFSTNRRSAHTGFRGALINGQPEDKGLYFPERIPLLGKEFFAELAGKPKADVAFDVIKPYVGGEIPDDELRRICTETVDFAFPLINITDRIRVLELFHGPTLAFKDVGARFMSRCLQYFSKEKRERTVVLVATSGDTGGAVANGFLGVENTDVVILYPLGKVSEVQELQLTTLGGNVTAIEVAGNFDDCQALAKSALADEDLNRKVFLTSANSINIARWLPQQFYYFFALQQWGDDVEPVISVPSGNFGNICAGILAHLSGLPANRFIAATNANDVIPRFIESGEMDVRPSIATISNAMDVGNPSNFVRILEIFGRDFPALKEKLCAVSVSDDTTRNRMRSVFETYGYVLDPHGAVAFHALDEYLALRPDEKGFFLETAHPVKFDSVGRIIGTFGEVPEGVRELYKREKRSIPMNVNYQDLKSILLERV